MGEEKPGVLMLSRLSLAYFSWIYFGFFTVSTTWVLGF